jgi:hypothetical protein
MVVIVKASLAMVSLCFIDGLKYSISHDDQSKMFILETIYEERLLVHGNICVSHPLACGQIFEPSG